MIFSRYMDPGDILKYPAAIQRAIQYAVSTDFSKLEDGRYVIDGDKMFANLFHLTSKPLEGTHPELHRKYIDVQYWLSGEELCGFAPAVGAERRVEERDDEDICLYDSVRDESFLHARQGCYAVFFPDDAHRPGVAVDGGELTYRKVVVKVRTDTV